MIIKIACDNNVGNRHVEALEKQGFNTVVRAYDRDDILWVDEALDLKVQVIISNDLDVPNILDRYRSKVYWIQWDSQKPLVFDRVMSKLCKYRRGLKRKVGIAQTCPICCKMSEEELVEMIEGAG